MSSKLEILIFTRGAGLYGRKNNCMVIYRNDSQHGGTVTVDLIPSNNSPFTVSFVC